MRVKPGRLQPVILFNVFPVILHTIVASQFIYVPFRHLIILNKFTFLRHLLGITKLDKEWNQRITEKTGAQSIVKEIKQYQKKWLQHVQRMDTNRLPKQALQYRPKGRRNTGRPRKRWRDQFHLRITEQDNTPNPSGTWWWWWVWDGLVLYGWRYN